MERKKEFIDFQGKRAEYWPLYKNLVKFLGIEEAVLLMELYSKQKKHGKRKKLDGNGFFYHERGFIEKELFITSRKQRILMNKLTECSVLEIKRIGMPPRNHYRVNEGILQYICSLDPNNLYKEWKENNKLFTEEKFGESRYIAPKKK